MVYLTIPGKKQYRYDAFQDGWTLQMIWAAELSYQSSIATSELK